MASRPPSASVEYLLNIMKQYRRGTTVCFTNAIITDQSYNYLTFANRTLVSVNSPPIFSRDAQVMKERVWRTLGLKGQVVKESQNERTKSLELRILDPSSSLQLLAPPLRRITYICRPSIRNHTRGIDHVRAFEEDSEHRVRTMLRQKAKAYGMTLAILDFTLLNVTDQVSYLTMY